MKSPENKLGAIAEHDNYHPLKDNLVEILLERMHISQFYAELLVQDGRLQRVGRINLLSETDSVMAVRFQIPQVMG